MQRRGGAEALRPLTSLRFVAAAAIVIAHLEYTFGFPLGLNLSLEVSFFFVLSGFILTYRYPALAGRREIGRFYLARVARIWPLHVATFIVAIAVVPGWLTYPPAVLVSNLFLVQSWSAVADQAMSVNGVAWSISDEAFFYLLFPLMVMSMRGRVFVAVAAVAIGVGVFAVGTPLAGPPGEPVNEASWYTFVHVNPVMRLLEFVIGCLTCVLYRRFRRPRLSVFHWTLVEIALVGVLVVALLRQWESRTVVAAVAGDLVAFWFVFAGAAPVLAAVILCFAYGGGLLSRVLGHRILLHLGEISFSTYMIHQILVTVWRKAGWADGQWNLPGMLALVLAIYGASYLSWRFFETPMRYAILYPRGVLAALLAKRWSRPEAEPQALESQSGLR